MSDHEVGANTHFMQGPTWRASLFCSLLCLLGSPVDAFSMTACEQKVGLSAGVNVIEISLGKVAFTVWIKNVTDADMEMTRNLVPWFNKGAVSLIMIDDSNKYSLSEKISKSRIKFDRQDVVFGSFSSKKIFEYLAQHEHKIKAGELISADLEILTDPPNTASELVGAIKGGSYQDTLFLWSMSLRGAGNSCFQYGISAPR